ncbi:RNA polymerase sigma factor [Pedobacter ginsengisoli]|uniref:RNA polymerase sigma factor n=1 Tax=Pedobacter ginsengisoli TaxID=363852 RepID=UPI00254C53BD|nr:RNA polymerase sigma-70 factor [Pedobacter ginsengisoli]
MAGYNAYIDQELIVLLKQGDHAAFTEIFNRYDRLLFIYAYKKLKDKEAAKDIVQDVFIVLWSARQNWEMKGSLVSYLYAAVRNKALNVFRDKAIGDKYLASLGDFINNGAATTDHLVREKEISSLIEQEISALPEKMRLVFTLRKHHFMSNKEIAEQLDISEQTVETHMKRALKTLRLRLGLVLYLVVYLDLWHFKK